jgi:predicted metal-dependent hydrolase
MAQPEVEVRRSARRRRTLTVFREQGRLVALVPARLSAAQERTLLPPLVERFLKREAARVLPHAEDDLARRARSLYQEFLADRAGTPLPPFQVRWVDNQLRRWGSCSTDTGTIRLSSRLRTMPAWVSDYVLLHELAHLFVPSHSAQFHLLLAGYPAADRARAFLQGYQHAVDAGGEWPDVDVLDDGPDPDGGAAAAGQA